MGESDERSDPLDEAARLFGHALEEWADGRPAQALQTCLDALAITERTLGPSLDTIGILNTLSGIRLDLSDYQGAFDASQRASAMVSMLVVDDDDTPVHAQVRIHTIATLARVERTLGRLEAAEQHYLEALTAAEAQAGADDASLAPMLNDLAVVYKYAARYDEAVTLYRRALAAIETSLGPEHADAATVWHNLGGIEHAAATRRANPTLGGRCRSAKRRWAPSTRRWPPTSPPWPPWCRNKADSTRPTPCTVALSPCLNPLWAKGVRRQHSGYYWRPDTREC